MPWTHLKMRFRNGLNLQKTPDSQEIEHIKKNEIAANEANNRCSDNTKSYQVISSKNRDIPTETIKSLFKNSFDNGISLANENCPTLICKMLLGNSTHVECRGRTVRPFDVTNLLDSVMLKNPADVSNGKNLKDCKWANKFPRRIISGCGACGGYVICKAENSSASFNIKDRPNIQKEIVSAPGSSIDTMRFATCNANHCGDNSAQACVDDPTVGSRNPNDDEEDATNVIQDQDLIKKASGQ